MVRTEALQAHPFPRLLGTEGGGGVTGVDAAEADLRVLRRDGVAGELGEAAALGETA